MSLHSSACGDSGRLSTSSPPSACALPALGRGFFVLVVAWSRLAGSCRPAAAVVARREVGLRSYTLGSATTKRSFDRRLGPACTALANLETTDHPDRSRRVESLRPTSGHGVRRRRSNGRCRSARPRANSLYEGWHSLRRGNQRSGASVQQTLEVGVIRVRKQNASPATDARGQTWPERPELINYCRRRVLPRRASCLQNRCSGAPPPHQSETCAS